MRCHLTFPALMFVFLLAGCSEPTIDASSEEAFYQSAGEISESLEGSEQEAFSAALMTLAMTNMDWSTIFAGEGSPDNDITTMLSELDGMTAEEIIARAEQARRQQEILARERAERERERRRENILTQIADLEARQQAAQEARQLLKRFEVKESNFYLREEDYGRDQPIIQLTVENRTYYPISRAYFHGVVASPGRAVPWISESFNYSIPGGLESGETSTWYLAPNSFSEWGTVDVPDVSYLEVTVERLDGPDGEPLWDAQGLSDREVARLERLRAELEEM